MSYATIDDLRSQLGAAPRDAAYAEKQLHRIPDAPVVKRPESILGHVQGKRVLEFGASGPMHEAVKAAASGYLGVDRAAAERVVAFDLDDISQSELPAFDPDVILCGEVLEHLANPGYFLQRLRGQFPGVPVVISVPNAFSSAGAQQLATGVENVNRDHVSWYSYRTLRTLLERYGYTIVQFAWYHGKPLVAEGLIVVAE